MATQTYTDGVTLTSATEFNLFDSVAYSVLSGVAGTNTITATGPANYTLAATRPPVWFIPAATNTGATTINITPSGGSALGAKNIFHNGAACVGGELVSGQPCGVIYDGTQFNIIDTARPASQTQMEAGAVTGQYVSPGRQQFHPSAAKFWIKFDGSGTPAASVSYNLTSITDNGVGDWTLNIATDFSSGDYAVVATLVNNSALLEVVQTATQAAGTIQVRAFRATAAGDTNKTAIDATSVFVAAFGDQ